MNNNQIPLDLIIKEIQEELSESLDKAGFYYRVFSRSKSISSIKKKLTSKKNLYEANGKKLQDIIGIRFVFYFSEDVWMNLSKSRIAQKIWRKCRIQI